MGNLRQSMTEEEWNEIGIPKQDGCFFPPIPNKNVQHPPHYGGEGNVYEVINIIEAYDMKFSEANILKYLLRYKKKNGLEDLKKAQWYLERLIQNLEK
jgi:hypothetical protein